MIEYKPVYPVFLCLTRLQCKPLPALVREVVIYAVIRLSGLIMSFKQRHRVLHGCPFGIALAPPFVIFPESMILGKI